MRGRKPKPGALVALEGNLGKRKRRPEPQPDGALPDCPAHLSEQAKSYWREYAPQLNALGLLTMVDAPAFGELCSAMALAVHAEKKIDEMGPVIEIYGDPSDEEEEPYLKEIRRNPYVIVWKQANEVVVKILAEFGMTPSSRSRVSASKKKEKKNPLHMWLVERGRKGKGA